ncbi:hypothetical protein PFLUV_G00057640 [Perca fluviatilis]|uniref:Fe2OG dioxygenase domain-containing protein n=1 Tax=Perca fluviatilis TaxID=8168 RepID=A0A6A5FF07_PERFL|nr:hypothetical protein PFLUV_G00057640 [Perca fluviatilis]
MENDQGDLMEQEEHDGSDKPPSSLKAPLRSTRLNIQRSNVCSRAYFVVIMVFFHVYILNVIGLLLYVHYNNGPGDLVSGNGASSTSVGESETPLPHPAPAAGDLPLHVEDYTQSYSLPRIEGIRVGHVQQVSLVPDRTHEMRTISLKPLLFEIPGFLSEEEGRVVVQLAQLKGLMESQTTAPSQGQVESNQPLLSFSTEEVFSLLDLNQDGLLQKQERPGQQRSGKLRSQFKQRNKHTWLYQGPGSHQVLQTLRTRLISLTRLPSTLVELSEPLQLIRYDHGDFSNAHHDSSPSHSETTCAHTRLAGNTSALTEVSCRYLTMLFYLSSVEEGGETTFPVADNRTYEEQALIQLGVDLTDTRETCDRGNMRIKPTAGTALLWYNHLSDGRGWMGELDEYSLHGDCPVRRGVKWMANSWVNVDPDHQRQARYQRLVGQRHQAKSGMEEHYQPLSHSDLHQDL